jgi:hypothetical protein
MIAHHFDSPFISRLAALERQTQKMIGLFLLRLNVLPATPLSFFKLYRLFLLPHHPRLSSLMNKGFFSKLSTRYVCRSLE